ncbi:MAG: CPBP family intramembrane glutamic endopeptidase [Pseudomonadales bacterium]
MPNNQNTKKCRAAIELVGFVSFALISKEMMDPLFGAYSGPASLLTTLVILTIYMHLRGTKWASLGLRALSGSKAKLLLIPQSILIFVSVLVTIVLLTKGLESVGLQFMSEEPEGEIERWGDIEGNLQQYLILIALSWISAGFGEELFFRGFVITQLQATLGDTKLASVLAVLLAALLFGYVHFYYQGLTGLVNGGVIGLIFGTFFLLFNRNLWPLILAHGFINSLGFTGDFLGWDI